MIWTHGTRGQVIRMTELERAIQWLEYLLQVKEANVRAYPHRAQDVGAVHHCRVLLDALRWRNADKEPPKQHQRCLVVKGNDFDKHPFIATYADDRWCGWEGRIPDITHWRPLPEAPKEG